MQHFINVICFYFLRTKSVAIISDKMKYPFYCVLIGVCVFHAFDNFGVTSDSSASLGLDVGRYLESSSNVGLGILEDDNTPWTKPHGLEAKHSFTRSERNTRTASGTSDSVGLGLPNRSSELNELFAAGSGNASITSRPTSKAKIVQLEGGSSVKTDQIQTNVSGVSNLSLNGSNVARPRPTSIIGLGLLPTNSNTESIVSSEGGVLQEGLSHSTTESVSLQVNLPTEPIKIDVKGGNDTRPKVELEVGLDLGLPTREAVSSLVNKQLEPQDSHITARKGANLSEQIESVNDIKVPLTLTSSEIDLDPNLHTQKITPRKGAELPKIFPRKGVDEQFVDYPNSSDQFSSDKNNTRTTVLVSTSTTAYSSVPTGNPTDIVKHINTSKSSRPSLQNDSSSTTKVMTEKSSTQSANSETSMTPASRPAMEAVTSKTNSTSDVAASNSNSTSNVNTPRPIIDKKNITLDKPVADQSGIIDSYPPLRKRPKPLKTTDVNSGNSSPITPEHSSSEHDYVIPIVVTILTVPMLVVLVLFLYKKGSEFWERRHYRRMDFLIDGMYND